MRPTRTRRFRPTLPAALLEERIALSTAAGAHANAHAHAAPMQVAAFPMSIADTIAAGKPVAEQVTTRFGPGADVQTETDQINPDGTNGTVYTSRTINLPNNGGTETATDFSYIAATGNTVHVITTYLPNGTYQIQNETFQTEGNTTLIRGTFQHADGTVDSLSGTTTVRGPVSTTDLTTQTAAGAVVHDHTVTVSRGELHQTTTVTETGNGRPKVTHSSVSIVRLQPPSSTALGNLKPGVTIAGPKLANGGTGGSGTGG